MTMPTEEWLKAHVDEHKAIDAKLTEHGTRLDNGRETFGTLHNLLEQLRPRPKPWWEMFLAVSGVLITIASAAWVVSSMLSARPTHGEVQQLMQERDTRIQQLEKSSVDFSLKMDRVVEGQDVTHRDVSEVKSDVRDIRNVLLKKATK